jgi:hypothetical protein
LQEISNGPNPVIDKNDNSYILSNQFVDILKHTKYYNSFINKINPNTIPDINNQKETRPFIHSKQYVSIDNITEITKYSEDKREIKIKVTLTGMILEEYDKLLIYPFGETNPGTSFPVRRLNFRFFAENIQGMVQGEYMLVNGIYALRLINWTTGDEGSTRAISFSDLEYPIVFSYRGRMSL